jgi:signal transduction histidine kinase
MLTITRYSSQLEEAQARIEQLETELSHRDGWQTSEVITSLAQELRTPMTSIAGYTDLLLSETIGILGAKQREFLQRIKANTERMGTLLDQIVQLTTRTEKITLPEKGVSYVADVVEAAVHAVITQIREKHLRLDLNVADDLPSLPINQDTLRQIIVHLLDNACRASAANGRISISAQAESLPVPSHNDHGETLNFIHIKVQDSGSGISVEDRGRVFAPQYQADHPLIAGLGDTGAGLSVARTLALANGGRVWVEGEPGVGSAFSVLFPLPVTPQPPEVNLAPANGNHKGKG